jgi:uncharacterized membrane protein
VDRPSGRDRVGPRGVSRPRWRPTTTGDTRKDARRESTGPRLDVPTDTRRQLVRRPQVDSDTFGRFAETFARFMGTARFLMYMTLFVLA